MSALFGLSAEPTRDKLPIGAMIGARLRAAFLSLSVVGGMSFAATDPVAAKTPTKAELGAMLKTCSEEADAKGLTVQKGKGEQRKAYRRACMMKNGVSPKK